MKVIFSLFWIGLRRASVASLTLAKTRCVVRAKNVSPLQSHLSTILLTYQLFLLFLH
ncbi:MAG: hypothetical protein LBP63_11320 [Prevotellaceae bacterium]|nr:hypothetical protein [Prevotellaceae bacterium]